MRGSETFLNSLFLKIFYQQKEQVNIYIILEIREIKYTYIYLNIISRYIEWLCFLYLSGLLLPLHLDHLLSGTHNHMVFIFFFCNIRKKVRRDSKFSILLQWGLPSITFVFFYLCRHLDVESVLTYLRKKHMSKWNKKENTYIYFM